jgi:hypothetical protein
VADKTDGRTVSFLLDKPVFGDKMRKFSISIRDSDLDILKRACQYGISSVSKLEMKNGEAARIKFALLKIIEQIDRKKA